MNVQSMSLVMIPVEELANLKTTKQQILLHLQEIKSNGSGSILIKNITAKEFMAAVRIGRPKFDQLVLASKIKTIKKRRKIYVPVPEIDRYFNDPSIQ